MRKKNTPTSQPAPSSLEDNAATTPPTGNHSPEEGADAPRAESTDADGTTEIDSGAGDDSSRGTSALARTPKITWVITALVATATGLGGYIIGDQAGYHRANETITQAVEAAMGSPDTTQPDGKNTGDHKVTALSFEEITKKLKPGTITEGPKPTDGEFYNADLAGGRGPVNSPAEAYNIHRRNPNDPFAIGRVDAPVVISEFSDFECPFCSRFANVTKPELVKKYIDSGYVRLEFNDLPINGPHAMAAAKAARAAAEQGRYPEFAEALFAASKDINGHPNFTIEDFTRFAQTAGVPDMDKFTADATGTKYDEAINRALSWAQNLGIRSTPSFVVGGMLVAGAQPTEAFENAINTELTKVIDGKVTVPEPDDHAGERKN